MDADSIQQDDLVAPIGADPIKQVQKPVAQVGAGPTKQVNPVQKIERVYLQIRKRSMCSSKDLGDIVEAYEKYKDTDFIIRVMKTASEENKARNGRLTINSLVTLCLYFKMSGINGKQGRRELSMDQLQEIAERILNSIKASSSGTEEKIHYECEICKDKEWLIDKETNSARPCQCREAKLYKRILEASGITEAFLQRNFENFKPTNKITADAKAMAMDYVKRFDSIKNLRNNSIAFRTSRSR